MSPTRASRLRVPAAIALAALTSLAACDRGAAGTQAPEANPAASPEASLVPNLEAQPGDTTTCPFSGRPFVVEADHPKVDYAGKSYWVCSEQAAEQVRADPDKYLADFEG